MKRIFSFFSSLKLTVFLLLSLIILIALTTLAQDKMGTLAACKIYLNSWFVKASFKDLSIPYFFGGKTLASLLFLNLFFGYLSRFTFSYKKLGLHLVHLGFLCLLFGQILLSFFIEESQIHLEEGKQTNYSTHPHEVELIIANHSNKEFTEISSLKEKFFTRGRNFQSPFLPFNIRITQSYKNALLRWRQKPDYSLAKKGVGPFMQVYPLPPVLKDEERNQRVLYVLLETKEKMLGSWMLSNALSTPQEFSCNEQKFSLELRERRSYYPFTIRLLRFQHERYEKTNIPKSFSSHIQILDEEGHVLRDTVISMNQPLRMGNLTFYQSGFGQQDALSILQVVYNPWKSFPYFCTLIISLGLVLHLAIRLQSLFRSS